MNTVWASDITYVRTLQGWLYLAVFMDLFSRRVVGWSLDRTMEMEPLVLTAFDYAMQDRRPAAGLIVHSDRGSQYASDGFRRKLEQHGCRQSMSRRANCWDNAPMESFFDSYKTETGLNDRFHSEEEVRAKTFKYMEGFYNRRRRHSTIGYRCPMEFEEITTERY